MFTGIVDACGTVRSAEMKGQLMKLVLKVPASYRRLKPGASVSVDGVCLTVTSAKSGNLYFDVIPETLKRSRFRRVKAGEALNLEKPLRWKGRVDGHLVQGHVDAVAKVVKVATRGKGRDFYLSAPRLFARALVEKGSVALNGVSLTVGRKKSSSFWVHVIPHTIKMTNLGEWRAGTKVNLETDVMLK